MLLSKGSDSDHSEKIATECPKLKFSIEKIKKVNLSKRGIKTTSKCCFYLFRRRLLVS